jgi:DNA-binding XRE family transcriptional regulator
MRDTCCSPWPWFIHALPFCHAELRIARPRSECYPKDLKNLGDHIRTRRMDLGLLQSQVAEQIGVHELTITNWEVNATVPEIRYMPAIIRFLGYDPQPPAAEFSDRLACARKALGLSQRTVAATLELIRRLSWGVDLIARVLQIKQES